MLHVLNVYTVHHFHAQLFHTKQIATIKWNRSAKRISFAVEMRLLRRNKWVIKSSGLTTL